MKFERKGFYNPRPDDANRKTFKSENGEFEEEYKTLMGNQGDLYILKDKETKEVIGNIFLLEDDFEENEWVKIRYVGIQDPYLGSGAINTLYDKAKEIAIKDRRNLVLDCVATIGAYKSFKRYLEGKGIQYQENPSLTYNEEIKTYKAPEHTWTIKAEYQNLK